jgi:hypothetical protein
VKVGAAARSHGLAALLFGAASVVLAPSGCGDPSHPAILSDFTSAPPSSLVDASASQFSVSGTVPVPSCNVGVDGGVCACADQTLVVTDPPTIYFVLDRSGSMAEGSPLTKWQQVIVAIYRVVVALGPRVALGVTVFPSIRIADSCAPGDPVLGVVQGDAPAGTPGPVAGRLASILGQIGPWGGTPTAATLTDLLPGLKALKGRTYVVLATDGGPNCGSAGCASAADCQINIENACVPQLQTCCAQGVNCCVDNPGSCNDTAPTVAAVQAISSAGIPVYVLGIPGSDAYAQILDQMAEAGGAERPTEPLYYAIDPNDQSALYAALSAIAGHIAATCTLTLDQPPADPGLLNVFLDGNPLAQNGDGGAPNWTLDGTTVTILGDACQRIQAGTVLDLRVVAGCPTVIR